jgi:hypothetical protein
MPRGGQNRMPVQAKRWYFELIREGRKGAAASRVVGVSTVSAPAAPVALQRGNGAATCSTLGG